MQFAPIKLEELTVGHAIPWPLYDSSGKILMEHGSKPEPAGQIQALLERGAGRHLDEQPVPADKADIPKQAQNEQGGYSLNQIKLGIGDSMQLQFQNGPDKSRCFVTLIGFLADQSIIITMPVINGSIMLVREGQTFVVRFFSGKNAYAFSAVAKKATNTPYPYLHLSYPHEVRGLVVRGSARAHAHINCHASTEDGTSYKCLARDISIGGTLIAVREKIGTVGEKLSLTLPVQINETEHMLNLPCQVRSINTSHDSANNALSYLMGLSFEKMTSQDTLVISALLYQNLVNDKDSFE